MFPADPDITTVLFADSAVATTSLANAAFGGYGRESTITASSTDLTSLTLSGYFTSVTSSGNGNLTTVDIDATMGALNLTNKSLLTKRNYSILGKPFRPHLSPLLPVVLAEKNF